MAVSSPPYQHLLVPVDWYAVALLGVVVALLHGTAVVVRRCEAQRLEVLGRGLNPAPKYLTGVGGDVLTDRCGGGGGGNPMNLGGGGSITSAGCVGSGITSAGRLGGGGEVDVVVFGMGRGQVVRAAGGGGGGDITAARCRRMGCGRLMFVVAAAAAATAAAMTIGSGEVVVVVVVVVVGVVTVVLRPVSSTSMKDTAVALHGRGAGGVFLALTALHDVNIPGGTHAKKATHLGQRPIIINHHSLL